MREEEGRQSVLSETVGSSHFSPAPLEDGNSWTHLLMQLLRKCFEIWHVLVLEGKEVSKMEGFEVQTSKWPHFLKAEKLVISGPTVKDTAQMASRCGVRELSDLK